MKEGDKLTFQENDEIWIYKGFDFGSSRDCIILNKTIKQLENDAGYYTGRWVLISLKENEWVLGNAPMDREQGFVGNDILNERFKFYMTLGEFKNKYNDGTNLI